MCNCALCTAKMWPPVGDKPVPVIWSANSTSPIADMHTYLWENSEPLPADFQKVWDENYKDLYES